MTNEFNLKAALRLVSMKRSELFILSTGVYCIGYVIWSIHAVINNLGLLPVLDTQYFVTGFWPSLILFIIYKVHNNSLSISRRLFLFFNRPNSSKKRKFIIGFLKIAVLSFTFMGHNLIEIIFSETDIYWQITNSYIFLMPLAIYVFLHIIPENKDNSPKFGKGNSVLINITLITSLIWYPFWFFPYLPQNFGGLKPRCVYLDLNKQKLSIETLKILAPHDTSLTSSGTIRTKQLSVLYSNSHRFLINATGAKQPTSIIEIEIGTINSIEWLEDGCSNSIKGFFETPEWFDETPKRY
jgi:hypothetical protein